MTPPDPPPATPAPAPAAGPAPAPGGPAAPAPGTPDPGGASSAPEQAAPKPAAPDVTPDGELKTTVDSSDPQAAQVDGRAGRQRQRNMENARLKIVGDMVAGNKTVFTLGDEQPAPLQTLGALMSEPVRRAFVEPDGWAGVRRAIGDKRVIVLRAQPGHGKSAAAIRLLQSPPDRRIFNIDRNVDLRRLGHWLETDAKSDDPLPRSSGFLLCEPLAWGDLPSWVLDKLETTLHDIDARLIITITTDAAAADADLMRYVVALPAPREQSVVLTAHLSWQLRKPTDATEKLLADPELAEFTGQVFAADRSMKAAADLAQMIGLNLDGATVDITRLRQRWAERATEDFEIWFGGLPDVPTRCLAIALAVLNGLPFEMVVFAADCLAEMLDGPHEGADGGDPRPPWRDPFTTTRVELLRLLRAQVSTATVRGPFGNAPAEVMEYVAKDYARDVLSRVWCEYRIQRPLLNWLQLLAENKSEEVRIWAGTALGLFATHSFDFVYRLALAPMGASEKFWLRDVAANALSLPAEDPRMRPLVEAVVAGWYHDAANRAGQATAARVWGVALGVHDPDRALNALERLTTVDDRRVARGIGDSMADLLLADEDGNAARVLRRVGSWLHDDRRLLTGAFVFLWLAENLTAEAEGEVTWPWLLRAADRDHHGRTRDQLLKMWHRVLLSGLLAVTTGRALARWADLAEADENVRTAFARMLAALPSSTGWPDPVELNLRAHLTQWRDPENLQPKTLTAYAVEAELAKRNGS